MNINDLVVAPVTAQGAVPTKQKAHLVPMYTDPQGTHTTYVGVALEDGRFFRAYPINNKNARTVMEMALMEGEVEVLVDPAAKLEYGTDGASFQIGDMRTYNNQPFRPGSTTNPISGVTTPNRFDSILLATASRPGMPLTPSPNLTALLANFMSGDSLVRQKLLTWLPTAFRKSFEIVDGNLKATDAQGIVTLDAIESIFKTQEPESIDTASVTNQVDTFAAE